MRPRTPLEVIDAAFALQRVHYGRLISLALLPMLPSLLFDFSISQGWWMHGRWLATISRNVISTACSGVAVAVVGVAIASVIHAQPIDASAVTKDVLRRGWTIAFLAIFTSTLKLLGFFLLLLPGLILVVYFFAIPVVAALEDLGVVDSLKRSYNLARRNRGRILLTVGLTTTVLALLEYAVFNAAISILPYSFAAARFLAAAVGALLLPVSAAVGVLTYYDARVRAEAYDLELLQKSLSGGLPGRG